MISPDDCGFVPLGDRNNITVKRNYHFLGHFFDLRRVMENFLILSVSSIIDTEKQEYWLCWQQTYTYLCTSNAHRGSECDIITRSELLLMFLR